MQLRTYEDQRAIIQPDVELPDLEQFLESDTQWIVPVGGEEGVQRREEDDSFVPVRSPYVYDVMDKNEKGQPFRVRRVNVLVEGAMRENRELRYLRHYHRTMYAIQKLRIQAGNRKGALKRLGLEEEELVWIQENIDDVLNALEKRLEGRCKKHLRRMPIWTEYLSKIKGIGPRLGASFVSIFATPKRFATTSRIYTFSGMKSEDGVIQKRKAGEVANWSSEMRMTLFKFCDSIMMTKHGYRKLYDQFKEREVRTNEAREPDQQLSKGHVNMRARRRVSKMFLSHFLQVWRTLEGLPVRPPYPIEYLGHTSVIEPFVDTKDEDTEEHVELDQADIESAEYQDRATGRNDYGQIWKDDLND